MPLRPRLDPGSTIVIMGALLTALALLATPEAVPSVQPPVQATGSPETFMPSVNKPSTPDVTRLEVGVLGFSDVTTRQVVRTSDARVYIFAPEIYRSYVRALRANRPGTPGGFSEVDAAGRPSESSAVWSVDAAIDAMDRVHLIYIIDSGPIVYRTFDTRTDTWGLRAQIASSPWPDRNNGLRQGSVGVALALDGNGGVHVAYGKTVGSIRRVYYNHNQGGWNNEVLADDQASRDNSHPALAFGPDGSLYLAWLSDAGSQANQASIRVRARKNGVWAGASEVDGNVFRNNQYSIDQGPSLLVSPDGAIHIAYIGPYEPVAGAPQNYAYGRAHHKVSVDRGASWEADDPPQIFTHNPSLATDPEGNLYMFGHQEAWLADGCANMLANVRPSGGAWAQWRTLATGCLDSSVSVKWSQYNWNTPNVLDLVYWTEKGPSGEPDYNQLWYTELRGGPGTIADLPAR